MSLTSELSSSTSWVNRYFKSRFGNVIDFVRKEGPSIKALETKVPSELRGQARSRIGTAFDYRIRLGLGLHPNTSSVISSGIALMEAFGTENTAEERFEWAQAIRGYLNEVDDRSEEGLAKTAILLAHLDAGFRSGGLWGEDMIRMAAGIGGNEPLTWDRILNVARPEETAEVLQLATLAKDIFKHKEGETTQLGPTFEGSTYVNGADGDLIIGGCLCDIKTTLDPRRDLPNTMRQLIGYMLLDWDDEYKLREVGVVSFACRVWPRLASRRYQSK